MFDTIIQNRKKEKIMNIYHQRRWLVELWIFHQQLLNLLELTVPHTLLVPLEKDQWIQLSRLSISLSRYINFNKFQLFLFIFLFIKSLTTYKHLFFSTLKSIGMQSNIFMNFLFSKRLYRLESYVKNSVNYVYIILHGSSWKVNVFNFIFFEVSNQVMQRFVFIYKKNISCNHMNIDILIKFFLSVNIFLWNL